MGKETAMSRWLLEDIEVDLHYGNATMRLSFILPTASIFYLPSWPQHDMVWAFAQLLVYVNVRARRARYAFLARYIIIMKSLSLSIRQV